MNSELDALVHRSLMSFAAAVLANRWNGREREAVSEYAFGHLLPQCSTGGVLFDPTQIGIEVAVPQLDGDGRKLQVCKDLVIWPRPHMTCWDCDGQPTVPPLAVLEWKTNRATVFQADVSWLSKFTTDWAAVTGYAVTLDLRRRAFLLSCTRVQADDVDPHWLLVA